MPVPWPKLESASGPGPVFSESQPEKIKDPEDKAMSLRQLRELRHYVQRLCKAGVLKYPQGDSRHGKRVKWTELTHHEICNLIVKKIIPPEHSCSWVEVVASGRPQRCEFYCSHSWGECFRDFMSSVEAHAKDRGISAERNYWICVYANDQHNVQLGQTLKDYPFYQALKCSDSTLLMLDKTAEALQRIWCVFELHETLCHLKSRFQIWTPLGRVGSGLVGNELAVQGLNRIDSRRAQASNAVDQRQILNNFAEVDETEGIKVLANDHKELDQGEPRLMKGMYEANLKLDRKTKFEMLDKAVIRNVSQMLESEAVADGVAQQRTVELVNLYAPGGAGTLPTAPQCLIDDGRMRGITLHQLRDFHQRMKLDFAQNPQGLMYKKRARFYESADMYLVDKLWLEKYRMKAGCSYVEIVAKKEAKPEYHVIYGSQVTFKDFMASLEWHAEARQLPATTAYFIVPFMLDPDEAKRPEDTKFTRKSPPVKQVIQNDIVVGQVMVLDNQAQVLTRCIPAWEAHMGISKGLNFDLAAPSGALATMKHFASKSWGVGDFDVELALQALQFDVATTVGGQDNDRTKFLGEIAGGHFLTEEEIPTSEHNQVFMHLNMRFREKAAGPVLREAGYTGDVSLVTRVHKACPNLKYTRDYLAGTMGETAVHTAAASGHLEVLQRLLELKAKPDPRDSMGETPLHYAAFTGQTEVVRLLLEKGADPQTTSFDSSETPLGVAELNPAYYLNINTDAAAAVLRSCEQDGLESGGDLGNTSASEKKDLQAEVQALKSELATAKQALPDIIRIKKAFNSAGVRLLSGEEMCELLRKVTTLGEPEINRLVEAARQVMVQQALSRELDCEWFLSWLEHAD